MSITGDTIIGTGNQGGVFRKFPSNDYTSRIDSLTVVIDSVTVTVTPRRLSNLFFLSRIFLWPLRDPLGRNARKLPKYRSSSSLCNIDTEDLWITGANHCSTVPSQFFSTDKCLTLWFRRFFNPSIDSFLGYAF